MVDYKAIEDFRDRVIQAYRPLKIVLFGSYAHGAVTEDSDVDILVILPFEGKNAQKVVEILTRVDPRFPIDLLVRTPEQIQDRLEKSDFFMREILETGKVLYETTHN